MLGLSLPKKQWLWSACGKHPVARDFIRLGRMSPLAEKMSEWVDKGYMAASGQGKSDRKPVFWRFWARGGAADELICGVLRDSSDSIGRTYPFLVLGTGPVPSWEKQWDLTPLACEGIWNSIEYFCTRNQISLAGMGKELLMMKPPEPSWREYLATREAGMKNFQNILPDSVLDSRLPGLQENRELHVALGTEASADPVRVSHILRRITAGGMAAPRTLFIGGTGDVTSLEIFWRPLLVGDFSALWR